METAKAFVWSYLPVALQLSFCFLFFSCHEMLPEAPHCAVRPKSGPTRLPKLPS
jgi:hypothetical protein